VSQLSTVLLKTLGAAMVALPLIASAGGDAKNGEALVASNGCAGCHGADGNSTAPNPILAGQYESYLVQALAQYKTGERSGGNASIMTSFVSSLSDQDIADIAAWFASQDGPLQHVK